MLDEKQQACLPFAMTKNQAVQMFGGVPALADALGITRQAIYQWPEVLDIERADRLIGAAVRLGIELPSTIGEAPTSRPTDIA